ncbi:putative B-cell receptor-associated protein 29/31 [Lupinus albus]|uniref:Endoplasmic reticulum transmembrane protein n=1 Tax=Lupinus albus TaxID=3870 RepID=A0A6A4R3R3_LUPAL|nr:putative B-cell receptor-associated protein 29/31 [Lupinus albus]
MTPLRKLVIVSLDRVKRGRGPVVVTTVGATLIVVLSSSLYSIAKIQQRTLEAGLLNPTDQVLMSNHILEASLMGIFLFSPFITFPYQNLTFYFILITLFSSSRIF